MERLQKVIANAGYTSRRNAETLISKGKVSVNGEIITELGYKVSSNDEILVEGNRIANEEKEYILLYKPKGVVSTTNDEKGRKTVLDLITTDKRLYPVGRLDYDTTGALLITNDGELTNLLIHPRNEIEKVYTVKIDSIIKTEDIYQLARGVLVDGKRTGRAKVKVKSKNRKNNSSIIELTIHEGKNHQVKKMFEALGYNVVKLKRTHFSFLDLTGLKEGEYRALTFKEVKKLYNETKKND